MPVKNKSYMLLLGLLYFSFSGWAQSDTITGNSRIDSAAVQAPHFIISRIFIKGNRKTKSFTIERELPFKTGDAVYLPELVAKFQRSKELLINTRLFNDVVVSLKGFRGYLVDVQIDVVERWYIFPVPYFRPIDRNLSAWADKHYSLSRVNYGLKFLYNNFTGRNDRLRAWLITGYTRQLQLNYDQPYADRSLKHGYGFGVFHAALKEVNTGTIDNRQVFTNTENTAHTQKYLFQQTSATLNYFYRPALTTKHTIRLAAYYLQTDSAIAKANPGYFNNGVQQLFYPELSYTLEYQKCDYIAYVLKGFVGDINFTRRGISSSMNLSQFTARFTNGWPLGHKFYFGMQGYGTVKLPLEQPFFNQRLLGYGDVYLRGLEKYVVDGVAGGMLRSTARKKLFGFRMNGGRIPSLASVPFTFYAKVYGDLGYVYNKSFPQNSLVNQLLYTAGAGIDVVSVYDFVFRCEYSVNQLGQQGLFFHIRNDF